MRDSDPDWRFLTEARCSVAPCIPPPLPVINSRQAAVTTMHRCLKIEEILCIISKFTRCKSDLIALALTCRILRDPALEALWEHLQDLGPLIRCLPEDLRNEEARPVPAMPWEHGPPRVVRILVSYVHVFVSCLLIFCKIQSLAREPDQTTDWSRFRFYASFIRSFKCVWSFQDPSTTSLIHPDIFGALAASYPERPILPRLSRLWWSSNLADPYIDLFTGPQLNFLTIQFPSSHISHLIQARALTLFTESMPNLHSVRIESHELETRRHPNLAKALSDLICGLQNLRSVRTNIRLNPEALRHLATSPCIDLEITNEPAEILQTMTESIRPPLFSELQSLTITSGGVTSMIRLIELSRAEKLQRLKICHDSEDHEVEWDMERLITTVGAKCSHTELTSIELGYDYGRNATPPPPVTVPAPLSLQTLAPLLTFRHLTSVTICLVTRAVDLDDGDIEQIAIAWPRLQSISLSFDNYQTQPKLTLASLVTLVKRCPELHTINLRIHVDTVDFSLLTPVTTNENVTTILLGRSTMSGPRVSTFAGLADIARFLSSLFPRLHKVHGMCWAESAQLNTWDVVSRHLSPRSYRNRETDSVQWRSTTS
jgi:hypothetical protein